jgi:hypothetical protein
MIDERVADRRDMRVDRWTEYGVRDVRVVVYRIGYVSHSGPRMKRFRSPGRVEVTSDYVLVLRMFSDKMSKTIEHIILW